MMNDRALIKAVVSLISGKQGGEVFFEVAVQINYKLMFDSSLKDVFTARLSVLNLYVSEINYCFMISSQCFLNCSHKNLSVLVIG